MLLGGKGGCQQCTCVPCDACTRTCTEPHTGTAFEPVYTRFFEGVEVGNPADGYLSASGDSDTSDPYDGMDGTGPWFQQVSGGFNDGGSYGSGTRFPCTYRFSFWRSSYTLGAGTIPPASTTLTENVITVTVSTGAVVFPDGRVFTAADGPVALSSVPLVSGGALATDPRTGEGSVSFALQCQNVETTFSVQARIVWATQKRQHVLYGIVRECYEDTPPTNCCPAGVTLPNELYITISNYTGPVGQDIDGTSMEYNGTYVLSRVPNFCNYYLGTWEYGCRLPSNNPLGDSLGIFRNYNIQAVLEPGNAGYIAFFDRTALFSGVCRSQGLHILSPTTTTFCGPGVIASGTNGENYIDFTQFPFGATRAEGSFDWEIEV
jgi:hypothetical protein